MLYNTSFEITDRISAEARIEAEKDVLKLYWKAIDEGEESEADTNKIFDIAYSRHYNRLYDALTQEEKAHVKNGFESMLKSIRRQSEQMRTMNVGNISPNDCEMCSG